MFRGEPTKVAIVKAGEWGDLRQGKGDYDSVIERLEVALREAKRAIDSQPAAAVQVVQSTQEALSWVMGSGTIVYISRGMIREAEKVAAEHLSVRVVLLTGLLPEGRVVFVNKTWISSAEQVENVVLRG